MIAGMEADEGTGTGRRGRAAVGAHSLALVLACLLAVHSLVGIWARKQVTSPDRYVRTVAPLATTPSIQELVTNAVTSAVADPERTRSTSGFQHVILLGDCSPEKADGPGVSGASGLRLGCFHRQANGAAA